MAENIPEDEIIAFTKYLKTYHYGDVIITEGEPNDNMLYLLRTGKVGVYRQVIGEELISSIEAINFFGEMELVIGGKRLATIKPLSNEVVVYAFKNPDLYGIISTSTRWGENLVTRLCSDLMIFSERTVSYETENKKLLQQLETMTEQSALLLAILTNLHARIVSDVVMGSKAWKYLVGIQELILTFSKTRLPEIQTKISEIAPSAIQNALQEDTLPKNLKDLLLE
jgi:CRP-like cAMP-binding protein